MAALRFVVVLCAALAAPLSVRAETALSGLTGSSSFCLFQVPAEEPGKQRWINLGIVQYVETGGKELRIVYGGGNFGSGNEVRIAFASAEEALAQLERMRQTAAACR
ncbi:MAG: hypothetical protein PHY45_02235 [Rhodocyclaceae bacterium]|nr:hypothetical protein [Rhodocyclaceae bacterium]